MIIGKSLINNGKQIEIRIRADKNNKFHFKDGTWLILDMYSFKFKLQLVQSYPWISSIIQDIGQQVGKHGNYSGYQEKSD